MMTNNRKALLDVIASKPAEGTACMGEDGYNILVGSTPSHPLIFDSYDTHPHIYNPQFNSTAAGRYQIIYPTWQALSKKVFLNDFSPVTQDVMALELIREKGGLVLIDAGRFDECIEAICEVWASLPGNSAGQHQAKIDQLRALYIVAGGTLASRGPFGS